MRVFAGGMDTFALYNIYPAHPSTFGVDCFTVTMAIFY